MVVLLNVPSNVATCVCVSSRADIEVVEGDVSELETRLEKVRESHTHTKFSPNLPAFPLCSQYLTTTSINIHPAIQTVEEVAGQGQFLPLSSDYEL